MLLIPLLNGNGKWKQSKLMLAIYFITLILYHPEVHVDYAHSIVCAQNHQLCKMFFKY